ncbi:MAG: FtsX-like permease family protein [Ruminococcaceae bacterium]|nr:FtsX-like permease family protein [Oscillospiraceae bacterium]
MLAYLVNLYHLRLVPTVKRLCARRRLVYTLLTTGVLWVSAAALSLLVFHIADLLAACDALEQDYISYRNTIHTANTELPDLLVTLSVARAEGFATAILGGGLWLLLSTLAVGLIMTRVVDAEAYVYGLYMICGSGRKQLRRQLVSEFLLVGCASLVCGILTGFLLAPDGTGFWPAALAIIVPCFLALVFLGASILAGRILSRPCLRMLDTADVTEYTVSPRRSVLWGLTKPRGAMAMAALSIWRMRKHYLSLCLTIASVAALVFAALTPVGQLRLFTPPTFSIRVPEGMSHAELNEKLLLPLAELPNEYELRYQIRGTAEALGTHVLVKESASGGPEVSIALGERYATDDVRIACGDGDTFDELGGSLTLPHEYRDIIPDKYKGYILDGVPAGSAVYVYPEGSVPPLSLSVGDTVRLYLPSEGDASLSDRVESEHEPVTVRITDVVAIPPIRDPESNADVCPRITEDILYLNPLDYTLFDPATRVTSFSGEEARAAELFESTEDNTCILVLPTGYCNELKIPNRITVIEPRNVIKHTFHDNGNNHTLPDDTYFVNLTSNGVGIFLGDMNAYLSHPDAEKLMNKTIQHKLSRYTDDPVIFTDQSEYRVERIIYTEASGSPYLLIPNSDKLRFSSMQGEVCAFRLEAVSDDIPSLQIVAEEAYLTECETVFSPSLFRRRCFLGTSLLQGFSKAMQTHGLDLQFPIEWFLHAETVIRNSFSFEKQAYLLADPYPYQYNPDGRGYLQADEYPRVLSGEGCFVVLGDTSRPSILSAEEMGSFALFDHDSIGRLQSESVMIESLYARNDWLISPSCETLPDSPVPDGHAVFITAQGPENSAIRPGDTVAIAIRADASALTGDFTLMGLSGRALLGGLLEQVDYHYRYVTVDRVLQGEAYELVISESDMAAVLNQSHAYAELDIYLPETAPLEDYLDLYRSMHSLTSALGRSAVLETDPNHITSGNLDRDRGDVTLRRMGYITTILIPLLAIAAQSVLADKRRSEYAILHSLGQTTGQRVLFDAAETLLTTVIAVLATAIACPIGYALTVTLAEKLGASLSLGAFRISLYLGLLGLTAVSVAFSCNVRKHRSIMKGSRHDRS